MSQKLVGSSSGSSRLRSSPWFWSSRPCTIATGFLVVLVWGVGCTAAAPDTALVRRVVDGDTIELADGRLVRYIGVDAPEVRRRIGERWVEDPEPYGRAATTANRRLVEGRRVRLEYDVQTHDRFGRLLAYVYVAGDDGRERLVNAELLRDGFAQPMTIPPNVQHAEEFRALAGDARLAGRGLWSGE